MKRQATVITEGSRTMIDYDFVGGGPLVFQWSTKPSAVRAAQGLCDRINAADQLIYERGLDRCGRLLPLKISHDL